MPSAAVSSQGTKFQVALTPGSSITLTAVSKATQAVCTGSNTLAVGDVVVFGAVTGMPEIAGALAVVAVASASSFTVNLDSSGFAAPGTAGAAVPQGGWVSVGGLNTYSGFDGQASEIDVTDMDSKAKEFVLGLQDFGNLQLDLKAILPTDSGQLAIRAAKASGTKKVYRIVGSDGMTEAFFAYAKKFSESSGVDQVKKGQIGLRITGAVATN